LHLVEFSYCLGQSAYLRAKIPKAYCFDILVPSKLMKDRRQGFQGRRLLGFPSEAAPDQGTPEGRLDTKRGFA
jgi:hypothetical protein